MEKGASGKCAGSSFSSILDKSMFDKLNMKDTEFLSAGIKDVFAMDELDLSQKGEPA